MQSGLCENEIRPGVLQSSIQKHMFCKNTKGTKAKATDYNSILSFLSGTITGEYLLNGRLKYSRFNLACDIRYNFIFGMFYAALNS